MLIGWHMVPTLAASAPEALAALRVAQEAGDAFPARAVRCADARDGRLCAGGGHQERSGHRGRHRRDADLGWPAWRRGPVPGVGNRRVPLQADQTLGAARRDVAGPGRPVCRTGAAGAGHAPLPARSAAAPGACCSSRTTAVNQLVARRLLERRGYTVVVASNGREALAILEDAASAGFGCVLMDVQMPEMDGFECTALIRDERTT